MRYKTAILILNIIIPLPVIQFVLLSYTHKHVLNDVTVKSCTHADSDDKTEFHTNLERK